MEKTALWLAKLHNGRFELTPKEEFRNVEPKRLAYYLAPLLNARHRHAHRVEQIKKLVRDREMTLLEHRAEILFQGHGDYHAKNILVGRKPQPNDQEYVAAVDFHSSYQLPRAFDVGTFMAQYNNMFFDHHDVQRNAPPEIFLETYMANAQNLEGDFASQVDLYMSRTCLSILYYLNKVGMSDSENSWAILVEAENRLASVATIAIKIVTHFATQPSFPDLVRSRFFFGAVSSH